MSDLDNATTNPIIDVEDEDDVLTQEEQEKIDILKAEAEAEAKAKAEAKPVAQIPLPGGGPFALAASLPLFKAIFGAVTRECVA